MIFCLPNVSICEFFGYEKSEMKTDDTLCRCIQVEYFKKIMLVCIEFESYSYPSDICLQCCNRNELNMKSLVDADDEDFIINFDECRSLIMQYYNFIDKINVSDNCNTNEIWIIALCIIVIKKKFKCVDSLINLSQNINVNCNDIEDLKTELSRAIYLYYSTQADKGNFNNAMILDLVSKFINNVKTNIAIRNSLISNYPDGYSI